MKRIDDEAIHDDGGRARVLLTELADNLWWCWGVDGAAIFRALDPERFEATGHDPHAVLAALSDAEAQARLEAAGLTTTLDEAVRALRTYLAGAGTWGRRHAGLLHHAPIAYFSAEFGLHESLPIYSGGLGVLAGDHLKSASDLGLPLIGVGLLYREGYFQQTLDDEGWQQQAYPALEPEAKGLRRVCAPDGSWLQVQVETQTGVLHAAVWEQAVGRVRLLLLDADVPENTPADRALTHRLYGGDERTRIRQELLLGVGGMRALDGLGVRPAALHLNEGHSAFAALEAMAQHVEREGMSLAEAREEVANRTLFTTHTPVPAGHDRFGPDLLVEHLLPLAQRLGLDAEGVLAFGRVRPECRDETFCMTVLAMKLAHRVNGVSFLHGRVSREMWASLYAEHPLHRIPIGHVTNGVHLPTFLAPRMARLLDASLPAGWRERQDEPEIWEPVLQIPDEAIHEVREGLKRDLVHHLRELAARQARGRGEAASVVRALEHAFEGDALLVGFARRFATYKRASLVLEDLEVLDALVNDPARPMRFVFAGKAHPRDEGGKRLLQKVFRASRDPRFLGKVVLLEGYDLSLGRALTRGVDVWLNNPRRPLEASGTSGQKAAMNGVLNCSILDGWWAEGFDGDNGFAIGRGEVHRDLKLQDARDQEELVRVLREEVAPLYYDRDASGLARGWLRRVKRAMATLGWRFNADRMVRDYAKGGYLPAAGVQLSEPR
ncbi:MAG: alpha-glucan family phosphorylase [Myxococcales bacterium]|nr:alpha-glucan family phosphorylase [Myxococcales bacterium]